MQPVDVDLKKHFSHHRDTEGTKIHKEKLLRLHAVIFAVQEDILCVLCVFVVNS
jgi:hypothetical protein